MSFSPRTIGDTRPFHNTFTTDSEPFSVDGKSSDDFSIVFINTSNKQKTTGSGTWSNITDNKADYYPSDIDVVVTDPGVYRWYPTVSNVPFDAQIIEIIDPDL